MEKNVAALPKIPLTVPVNKRSLYSKRYNDITRGTGRLFLLAGDQKIEHLNKDFFGHSIPKECGYPEHLFDIAAQSPIGVFATQLGLIARYGHAYSHIPYLVKINSKTNLLPLLSDDPLSRSLHTVSQVVEFAELNKLNIVGIGYTIYLGSKYESIMLEEASQLIYNAHSHGMIVVLWIYPRGQAVKQERHPDTVAGAAGVATVLGADFVKIMPPEGATSQESALLLQQAVHAAGSTGVICSGGTLVEQRQFLQQLYDQLTIGGAAGCAVGRNVHQRTLGQAQALCNAIAAIVYQNNDVATAITFLKGV